MVLVVINVKMLEKMKKFDVSLKYTIYNERCYIVYRIQLTAFNHFTSITLSLIALHFIDCKSS